MRLHFYGIIVLIFGSPCIIRQAADTKTSFFKFMLCFVVACMQVFGLLNMGDARNNGFSILTDILKFVAAQLSLLNPSKKGLV